MDKMSIGKDIMKVYKIKPKKSMSSDMEEEKPEMEEGSDPAAMLREAADMIDEGNIEDAYGIIDEAVEMCKEMHGSDSEEEYD
jgi:hypothetical protein